MVLIVPLHTNFVHFYYNHRALISERHVHLLSALSTTVARYINWVAYVADNIKWGI